MSETTPTRADARVESTGGAGVSKTRSITLSCDATRRRRKHGNARHVFQRRVASQLRGTTAQDVNEPRVIIDAASPTFHGID
ncbi:MAG: hypothetical protein AAGI37_21235 [Planctomycetota bacterium]